MATLVTNLRLTQTERDGIRRAVARACDELGVVWRRIVLFGSRVDPARRGGDLTVGERESCEALTSRFARLNDFLLQRVFRTLDQIELMDEGTPLDRLHRAEARGLIASAERWRELRMLRNAIAHDYLIESADRVVKESLIAAPELLETAERLVRYVSQKDYCSPRRW